MRFWTGQEEGVSPEQVLNRCVSGVGTSKEDFQNYAGCAADIYCGIYGVPPGICGSIASEIVGAIASVFEGPTGPGPLDLIIQTMELHNKLFPREPKWDFSDATEAQVVRRQALFGYGGKYVVVPKALGDLYYKSGFGLLTGDGFALTDPIMGGTLTNPALYIPLQQRFVGATGGVRYALITMAAQQKASSTNKGVPPALILIPAALGVFMFFRLIR